MNYLTAIESRDTRLGFATQCDAAQSALRALLKGMVSSTSYSG
jgi:hypothetical protein